MPITPILKIFCQRTKPKCILRGKFIKKTKTNLFLLIEDKMNTFKIQLENSLPLKLPTFDNLVMPTNQNLFQMFLNKPSIKMPQSAKSSTSKIVEQKAQFNRQLRYKTHLRT